MPEAAPVTTAIPCGWVIGFSCALCCDGHGKEQTEAKE
jgi:hypothetical protein